MNIEDLAREQKLAELAILQQSLTDRDERIRDLQKKIEVLEEMLQRANALHYRLPLPQPLPAHKPAPRRWNVR